MNTPQLIALLLGVVGVFWAVGAYNRLIGLRNDIAARFVPVDTQLQHRHGLLMQWADGLRKVLENDPQQHAAVEGACGQLQVACDALRARPGAQRAAVSLRLAEEALTAARLRLHAELPARQAHLAGLELEVLSEQLAAADNTLAYARGQFNEATARYNAAIRQFPASLLASTFGFRAAGTL